MDFSVNSAINRCQTRQILQLIKKMGFELIAEIAERRFLWIDGKSIRFQASTPPAPPRASPPHAAQWPVPPADTRGPPWCPRLASGPPCARNASCASQTRLIHLPQSRHMKRMSSKSRDGMWCREEMHYPRYGFDLHKEALELHSHRIFDSEGWFVIKNSSVKLYQHIVVINYCHKNISPSDISVLISFCHSLESCLSIYFVEDNRLFLHGNLADLIAVARQFLFIIQERVVYGYACNFLYFFKSKLEWGASVFLYIFP